LLKPVTSNYDATGPAEPCLAQHRLSRPSVAALRFSENSRSPALILLQNKCWDRARLNFLRCCASPRLVTRYKYPVSRLQRKQFRFDLDFRLLLEAD